MRKFKNHITAFAFLAIVSFPAIIFIYFQIQQKIVQHEMIERLEHSKLEQVTIHNDSVLWYKKGKEIIFHSQLFDVHAYRVNNDSTIFKGLFDIRETALKNQVKKIMERNNENNSSRDLNIAKLMLQVWINDNSSNDVLLSEGHLRSTKNIIKKEQLISRSIPIPLPPPKI